MMTLKFAMIMMVIGSNMSPMQTENIHTPMTCPSAQIEIINKEAVPAPPVEKADAPDSINQDKTYEQCMKEAFDRIYEEVNKLLDQIPDQTNEQFQLQRTM